MFAVRPLTMPKALRPFFRHDRRLFADVSGLIYRIVHEFYDEAAGRPLLTGMVIVHQTFGDMLRPTICYTLIYEVI